MTETFDQLAPGWAGAVRDARPWNPPTGAYLVVVPHPDDEAVMFGGLLARLAARRQSVHLVAVTNGEAAYPGVVDGAELAARRRTEQTAAVAELGLRAASFTWLGFPDGAVSGREAALVDALTDAIVDFSIDVVLAPWAHDHHTDHEASGRAAARAASQATRPVQVVSGLFWSMLREPAPDGMALHSVELSPAERERKQSAIRCHRSQIGPLDDRAPVLGEAELAITSWPHEHVIVEPEAAP